jgi:hypothetical protein
MRQLLIISAVVLLLDSGGPVRACTCDDPSLREKFRSASAVFVGTVTAIENASDDEFAEGGFVFRVTMEVERQWKGRRRDEVTLLWQFSSPECGGLMPHQDEAYLIFAYRARTSLAVQTTCGPNSPAAFATHQIARLDSRWFRLTARLWPYPRW